MREDGRRCTWEERMAEKAAARAVVSGAEAFLVAQAQWDEAVEAARPAVRAYLDAWDLTVEDARQIRETAGTWACACVGPPASLPRGSPCCCALRMMKVSEVLDDPSGA